MLFSETFNKTFTDTFSGETLVETNSVRNKGHGCKHADYQYQHIKKQ